MRVKELTYGDLGITYAGSGVRWYDKSRDGFYVIFPSDYLLLSYLGVERGIYMGSDVSVDVGLFTYEGQLLNVPDNRQSWLYSVHSDVDMSWHNVLKYCKYLNDTNVPHGFHGLWSMYLAIDVGMHFAEGCKYIFPQVPPHRSFEDGAYLADPFLIMTKDSKSRTYFEIGLHSRANVIRAGDRIVLTGTKYEPEKYSAAPPSAIGIGRKR